MGPVSSFLRGRIFAYAFLTRFLRVAYAFFAGKKQKWIAGWGGLVLHGDQSGHARRKKPARATANATTTARALWF